MATSVKYRLSLVKSATPDLTQHLISFAAEASLLPEADKEEWDFCF